jgi:uncharacterized membrane protein YhiD involved in acid resistance
MWQDALILTITLLVIFFVIPYVERYLNKQNKVKLLMVILSIAGYYLKDNKLQAIFTIALNVVKDVEKMVINDNQKRHNKAVELLIKYLEQEDIKIPKEEILHLVVDFAVTCL